MTRARLLALASGGGHWIELMRLQPAFADFNTSYVSMFDNYAEEVEGARFYSIPDASRFKLSSFAPVFVKALKILAVERPAIMLTTGSAPMLVFVLLGRLIGCKTLWVDSIANAECLSASGRIAKRLAHQVISQWPDVAAAECVEYWGRIV